ncbi:hypothetical protein ACHAQJ_008378 [Trichoderma viride]
MTRPSIIRADTIDLQDHHAPSAQDQSAHRDRGHKTPRSPTANAPVQLAPHQAETLRDVAHSTAEEQSRSPRAAFTKYNGPSDAGTIADAMDVYQQHQHQQDSLAVAQNGGMDDDDIEDDGDLDDDMMDRISSSPSIEDGACSSVVTPVAWPRRVSSLSSILRTLHCHTPSPGHSTRDTHFPQQIRIDHLLSGEYAKGSDGDSGHDDICGIDETTEDESEMQSLETKG